MKRRVMLLVVTFVAALAGGTAAWWGFPPVARAATCHTYYTQATNIIGASYAAYGVKAGNGSNTGDQVFNLSNIVCEHISSLIAVFNNATNDFVEVGWYKQQVVQDACDDLGHPKVFWASSLGGTYHCHDDANNITLSLGVSYPVSLRNLDSNPGAWQILFNNVYEAAPQMGPQLASGDTNGERHYVGTDNTIESAKSDFTAMQYYQHTSSSWVPWNSHQCFYGPDPGNPAYVDPAFHNQFPSGDSEVAVVLGQDCTP